MAYRKLQYQAISAAVFIPAAVVAPPVGGCFSTFSQPAPKVGVAAHLQPQPAFETGFLGPAPTPPWFTFSTFSQPRFGPVIQGDHTTALFEVANPPQQTLVFSTFSQPPPKVGVAAYLQPQVTYDVGILGPAPTPTTFLVFSEFSPPAFYKTTVKVERHPEVKFRILVPDGATPGALVFSTFSQPRFSTAFPAHQQQTQITDTAPQTVAAAAVPYTAFSPFSVPQFNNFKYELHYNESQQWPVAEYVPVNAGGTSRKLPGDRRRTGLEPVKKQAPPPAPTVSIGIPLPPFRDNVVPEALELPPADIVDRRLIPPTDEIELLGQQIAKAEKNSLLIRQMEQDEQDIADLLEVLARLD